MLAVLVGLERLELSTSRLSGVRSNHLSYRPVSAWSFCFRPRQARRCLGHVCLDTLPSPTARLPCRNKKSRREMALSSGCGPAGVSVTYVLTGSRRRQLALLAGTSPADDAASGHKEPSLASASHPHAAPPPSPPEIWWSWSGSNRRPPACKADALPAELQPQAISRFSKSRVAH